MLFPVILAAALAAVQTEPAEARQAAPLAQSEADDEAEVCRKKMVEDPKAAGRLKRVKLCKTSSEWKQWSQRKT